MPITPRLKEENGKAIFAVKSRLGNRADLPMARADALKSAAHLGDADKQESLF